MFAGARRRPGEFGAQKPSSTFVRPRALTLGCEGVNQGVTRRSACRQSCPSFARGWRAKGEEIAHRPDRLLAVERSLVGAWLGSVGGEPVRLVFREDGHLDYEVDSGGRRQIMLLTYRVEGDAIVTDQPSHSAEERTVFRFAGAATLVLTFGGVETTFERRGE